MAQVVLLTTTHARWPAAIRKRPLAQGSASELPSELSKADFSQTYWLGYSSPLDCLHQALLSNSEPDIASLLTLWEEEVEAFLRFKRAQPQICRLLNLPKLTESAIEELLGTSDADVGEPALGDAMDQGETLWISEPSALAKLVIGQRRDLIQLYADLEAQADLLGREPEFRLDLPSGSDPALGAELVLEWQQQRRQAAEYDRLQSDHLNHLRCLLQESHEENLLLQKRCGLLDSELQQAKHEEDNLNNRNAELMEALRVAESQLALEIRRSAENTSEAAAQLHDSEEEKELILLQLKQVQEELGNTFTTLQNHQSNGRQLEDNLQLLQQQHHHLQSELEDLAQESRYLFLHSQLLDTVDRTRLPRILNLMRQSLQA